MSEALKEVIAARIRAENGISIAEYMELCLGHPEYGYYNTRDPFGPSGDFVTAPEISQMFGEMIGAWVADSWIKMGAPDPFYLIECGPGRGTLMHDMLRATKNIESFHRAVQIHLVEMSPVLKEKQQQVLKEYNCVTWHNDLKTLPCDAPVIIIGNEFLDALSVSQYTYVDTKWMENYIKMAENASFRYDQKQASKQEIDTFPRMMFPPKDGDQLEVSHEQESFTVEIINIIKKQGGIALFIDYGYTIPSYDTTLQAVMNHAYVDVLENQGECDLTAQVNFSYLGAIILQNDMVLHGPVSQKDFLQRLGIDVRAEHLCENASGQQVHDIQSALTRLTGPLTKNNQMGELFKVIAFAADPHLHLEGFS